MKGVASPNAKLLTAPAFWATLSIALAVGVGVVSNASLDVPPEIDHYRDMGSAQALLDGRFGEDTAFRGETAWYPPLLPALMALAAVVSSKPLPWVYVHFGPLFNAAAPITFYLLARHLSGRWTAVFSLVAYLFLANPRTNTWTLASYSPWAWPVLFAQALFYLALRAWLIASEKNTTLEYVLAGGLIGLTFLAHPAPAVLLVLITVVTTGARVWRSTEDHRLAPLRGLLTAGATAALVCSPYLVPMIAEYGMVTRNAVPSRYGGVWVSDVVLSHLSLRTVGASAGAAWLFSKKPPSAQPRWQLAIAMGLATASAGILYGMAVQKLEPRGLVLPMLFPTFHFLFYLHALEAMLFGPSVAWLLNRLGVLARVKKLVPSNWHPVLPQLGIITLVCAGLPGYLARYDYTHWPNESRKFAADDRLGSIYHWAKANLGPNDVVLARPETSMFSIVAAGHAIVSAHPSMMNPYVALEPREQARDAMFANLKAGDFEGFVSYARKLGVTYVIAEPVIEAAEESACCELDPASVKTLPSRFTTAGATIYAVPTL